MAKRQQKKHSANFSKRQSEEEKSKLSMRTFTVIIIATALVITIVAVIMGGYSRGGLDIQVGSLSPVRFVATRDVINTVATERLKEDARRSVTDTFIHDIAATNALTAGFYDSFTVLRELHAAEHPIMNPAESADDLAIIDESALRMFLSVNQIDAIVSLSTEGFNEFYNHLRAIIEDILQDGVRPGQEERSRAQAREMINALEYPLDMRVIAYAFVDEYIAQNQIFDPEDTQRRREEKAEEVEPVVYLRNQKIVDENEIITEEAYEMLVALGLTTRSFYEHIIPSMGAVIITVIVYIFSVMYISHFNRSISNKKKTIMLIFTLYIITIIMAWIMAGDVFFYVPILVFTMLISMLISHRLSIFLNFSVVIITMLIFKGDMNYLVFYLIAGTAIGFLAVYTTERNKIILVGLLSALVNVGVVLGYTLFFDVSVMNAEAFKKLGEGLIYASLVGFFSVILATGSLPMWEALFGIITPLKLLDLTNPSNKILRRLTIEAPGTYHHSLIVANLAETAAHDIGANAALARVGAYYHDIGKLKYPQYFSENITNKNPHDTMKVLTSIKVIKSHVEYGLEMAAENKLPAVIRDIIASHHGTTLLKYFYYKTKNEHPDLKINEADFRYDYPKPMTREAAVVMLADTVEAAVRSKNQGGGHIDEIEETVRALIKDKLDDNQLALSGLAIKDLDTAALAFMRVFKGMYHDRIPYPTDKAGEGGNKPNEIVSEVLERT